MGIPQQDFEEIVRVHGSSIYGLLVRLVRDRGVAEDLWQETFFSASREIAKGRPIESPAAWLRVAAARKAVDHLRRTASRNGTPVALDVAAERVAAPRPNAVDFEDELARLPDRERVAVLLAYREGLSMRDIAALWDAPVGTVKTWLRRAREELRSRYEGGSS